MRQIAVDEMGVAGRAGIFMYNHSPSWLEEGKVVNYFNLVVLVLR